MLPCFSFFIFRRFDSVELFEGEVAVANFLVGRAEARVAGRFGAGAKEDQVLVAGVIELL